MNVLISILGGVVFFGLIIVSVLLHEAGHFIPAKLFGMKAVSYTHLTLPTKRIV